MNVSCCRICFNWYPMSNFHKNKNRKKGIDNECKQCKNKIDTARYIKKRKAIPVEEKVRQAFTAKRLSIHSEGFDIIYKQVMSYIDSIPDCKWEETVNELLQYKYNAVPNSSNNCNSLLYKRATKCLSKQ